MPLRPSLSDYRAVLFDVDGTLVDSLEMIVIGLGDTIEKFLGHRPSDADIRSLIGVPLGEQMRGYAGPEATQEEVDEMSRFAMSRFDALEDREALFEDAIEVLKICYDNGLKTALVTSKSKPEIEPFLERFIATSYVHTAVSSSDVRAPKPSPDSALLACERLEVEPNSAIFIGDSIYDIRCAKSAGMASVAVAYGAAPAEVLEAESPDLLIHTPQELFAWATSAFFQKTCREKS